MKLHLNIAWMWAPKGALKILSQGSICTPSGIMHPVMLHPNMLQSTLVTDGKCGWPSPKLFIHLKWKKTHRQVRKCSKIFNIFLFLILMLLFCTVHILLGTSVGKVDATLNTPTPITYSVQEDDGESLFLLSPLSGEFILSRSLDFEAQSLYVLTVMARQGDSQVSSVRVYFNVLDVNDNPPVFSWGTFSAFLLEDTGIGTCFLTLNVSDKDAGKNINSSPIMNKNITYDSLWTRVQKH